MEIKSSIALCFFRIIQKFKLRQGKNNEKFCNFANFVRNKVLNSQFAFLFIGQRPKKKPAEVTHFQYFWLR